MTTLPLTPTSADGAHLDCHYFNADLCRSCSLIKTAHVDQVANKEAWCREVLADHSPDT